MKPSSTISESAGKGMPVSLPFMSSIGRPRRAPAAANSDAPSGGVEADAALNAGGWPTLTANGQASPRAQYFLRMVSPCLPGSMKMVTRLLVLHLHAVGAEIDPVAVRILGDDHAFGADVAAAVALVPVRGGKFQHVDLIADHDVFQHRAGGHDLRRDRVGFLAAVLAVGLHQLKPFAFDEHARGADIHRHAEIVRIAFDLLEQQDRRDLLGLAQRIERAHFEVRIGAIDDLELAHLIGELEAFAQVAESRVAPCLLVSFGHAAPYANDATRLTP